MMATLAFNELIFVNFGKFRKNKYSDIKPANFLSVFDHFVGLALKGLRQVHVRGFGGSSYYND